MLGVTQPAISAAIRKLEAELGVPKEIILSIIGVETYYGRIAGSWRVLDASGKSVFSKVPEEVWQSLSPRPVISASLKVNR